VKTRKGNNSEKERRMKKELKEQWKNDKKNDPFPCASESPGSSRP